MIISVLLRVLKLIITGVICSSLITLSESISATTDGFLYVSFLLFIVAFGVDAYRFSYHFWRTSDYYFGQLIPLIIYVALCFLMYFVFEANLFNLFFCHFRFAEIFTLKTMASISIVSVILVCITNCLRYIASKKAKKYIDWFAEDGEYSDEELEKFQNQQI